jgi:ABC-type uncharacterized transport system involved in gliding motility auxiliary subunit
MMEAQIATGELSKPSFTRGRSWSISFHVVLSSLALLGLIAMFNYLAHRHNHRLYLSQVSAHKLTPLTLQTLANLTNTVKVICFFDRREGLFGAVAQLLKEYQARSSKIELEFVDYGMPGRAQAVRSQYKLAAEGETSRVIFDSAGQVRTVLSTELSEYGMSPEKEIRRTGFRGEQMFTSAILNVTQTKPVHVYFLQGHGEHNLSDESQGYSRFARMLENNNMTVRLLRPLVGTNEIPADCGLLIAGGPLQRFEQDELVRIDRYLARGGRMLALLNIQTRLPVGLEQLLINWNVRVGLDWVSDSSGAQANNSYIFLTGSYGSHPIVRPLLRSTVKLVGPRSVSQRAGQQPSADAPKIAEILFTSSAGRMLEGAATNAYVAKEGNIPLAVAGERGTIQGVNAEGGSTRFVVVGESLFVSNAFISDVANSDFANQIVNWLVNRDALLNEIGPSPLSEYKILLTERQMQQVRWLFLGVIPGIVVVFGYFVWLRRRV